jgi:catalase
MLLICKIKTFLFHYFFRDFDVIIFCSIQQRAVNNFTKCDPEYGRRLKEALSRLNQKRQVREKSNL